LVSLLSSGFVLATNKKKSFIQPIFVGKKKMPKMPDFEDLKKKKTTIF
jgi:hypothetical protein